MSRLLTLLLLYRSGYIVGKYISIEKLISDTKETYYEALQASSYNWHRGDERLCAFLSPICWAFWRQHIEILRAGSSC